jgi:hypothetical protein
MGEVGGVVELLKPCSGLTKAAFVEADPVNVESTFTADGSGALTTTFAAGVFTKHEAGKTRSHILPWHRKENWQLSALDSAIGKIAITNARIKLENFIFLLAR